MLFVLCVGLLQLTCGSVTQQNWELEFCLIIRVSFKHQDSYLVTNELVLQCLLPHRSPERTASVPFPAGLPSRGSHGCPYWARGLLCPRQQDVRPARLQVMLNILFLRSILGKPAFGWSPW